MGYEREKQIIRSKGLYCTSGVTADTGNITATAGGFKSGAASTFGGKVTLSSGLTVTKTLTCSSAATITKLLTASSAATITKTLTASSGLAVTGTATVGKLFTASSAATVTKTLTASSGLTVAAGFRFPVTNAPTTGTLPNYGFSRLTATTASKNYTLAPPVAGVFKVIGAGSTLALTVTCTTGTYFQASTHADAAPSTAVVTATFDDGTDCLLLMGCSTVRWQVLANVGTVALS